MQIAGGREPFQARRSVLKNVHDEAGLGFGRRNANLLAGLKAFEDKPRSDFQRLAFIRIQVVT